MQIDSQTITHIIQSLQRGELIYMPTDTIPGLIARASHAPAVQRIYELKQRDLDKPPTIIIADTQHVDELQLYVPEAAREHMNGHWPGAVSYVLPHQSAHIDSFAYLHRGKESLAVRMTAEPWLQEVVTAVGPLATSSANIQSKEPATRASEARAYFGDALPLYVEHEPQVAEPSKIFVITDEGVERVR